MLGKDKLFCFILAGGEGNRLGNLTKNTCKPLVKLCSHYHLIDFTLINCFRANILNMAVIVQYESIDLIKYLFQSNINSLTNINILPPTTHKGKTDDIVYKNTAHSVQANQNIIPDEAEDVLVLSADHVYAMDYNLFYDHHKELGADLTISVIDVPIEEASRFGVFTTDENDNILNFEEKPENPESSTVSMGVYVFKKQPLMDAFVELNKIKGQNLDFGKDILPYFLEHHNVGIYRFKWPWLDVGTIDAFWKLNMDFLDNHNHIDYFLRDDMRFKISNNMIHSNPSYIEVNANLESSLVGSSSLIKGEIIHSIVGNSVVVEKDAKVENSVIMDNCVIREGVHIKNSVISQDTVVEEDVISVDEIICK